MEQVKEYLKEMRKQNLYNLVNTFEIQKEITASLLSQKEKKIEEVLLILKEKKSDSYKVTEIFKLLSK